MRERRSAEGREDRDEDQCEPGKFPFPGAAADKDTGKVLYDCSKARLLGSIFFRYEKISEAGGAAEEPGF